MAVMQRSALKTISSSSSSRVAIARPSSSSRSRCVVASASKDAAVTRREALGAAVFSIAALSNAAPAQAFFGFNNDEAIKEEYTKNTANVLTKVNAVLSLPKDDPNKDEMIKDLRKDINTWVAAYRREPLVSGRPSYGNTYSALNALAGHYNNFGTTAPIPKKRLERLQKELDDASALLARGR